MTDEQILPQTSALTLALAYFDKAFAIRLLSLLDGLLGPDASTALVVAPANATAFAAAALAAALATTALAVRSVG